MSGLFDGRGWHKISPDALRLLGGEEAAAAEVVRVVVLTHLVPPDPPQTLGPFLVQVRRSHLVHDGGRLAAPNDTASSDAHAAVELEDASWAP